MPLLETITVLNKSGKVVGTGKSLRSIYLDAKDAYKQKKADIVAARANGGKSPQPDDDDHSEDDRHPRRGECSPRSSKSRHEERRKPTREHDRYRERLDPVDNDRRHRKPHRQSDSRDPDKDPRRRADRDRRHRRSRSRSEGSYRRRGDYGEEYERRSQRPDRDDRRRPRQEYEDTRDHRHRRDVYEPESPRRRDDRSHEHYRRKPDAHSRSRSRTPSDDDCPSPVDIRTDSQHRRRHRPSPQQRRDSSGSDIYESEIVAPETPGGGPVGPIPRTAERQMPSMPVSNLDGTAARNGEIRASSSVEDIQSTSPAIACHQLVRRPVGASAPNSGVLERTQSLKSRRSSSASEIEIDVPAIDATPTPLTRPDNEVGELKDEVSKLQKILDEANCVQHSVTSTIESLQKNPEQLAAVALTLAKISTMARKMPPGAVLAMRGAFPAAIALLVSPQFLIAAGATAGVTVVALGGYKIIKRIRRKKRETKELEGSESTAQTPMPATVEDEEEPLNADELRDLDNELKHINTWHQGIDLDGSVIEEFATPAAAAQMISDGILRQEDINNPAAMAASAKQQKADKKAAEKAAKEAAKEAARGEKEAKREAKRVQKTLEQAQDQPGLEQLHRHSNPALARLRAVIGGEEPGGFKALFKSREAVPDKEEELAPPALPYRPLSSESVPRQRGVDE